MPNGNGTVKKIWIGIAGAFLVAFFAFTVHKIYIADPECYAKQKEVQEIKSDIKIELERINRKLDKLLGWSE